MEKLKSRINSDKAATLSTEHILLLGLAVFGVLVIFSQIMVPLRGAATNIGQEIELMGE